MSNTIKAVSALMLLASVIISVPQWCLAQEKEEKNELRFELEGVVVTGTKTEKLFIDVPVRVEEGHGHSNEVGIVMEETDYSDEEETEEGGSGGPRLVAGARKEPDASDGFGDKTATSDKDEALLPTFHIEGEMNLDVWGDQHGEYYNNDDSKLFFFGHISDHLTVTVGLALGLGGIPTGAGAPDDRWFTPEYWGTWLTWEEAMAGLDLCVGDVVYQFGTFNYYLFKTASIIAPETFLRGVQATKELGETELNLFLGPKDANGIFGTALACKVPLGSHHSMELYSAFDWNQAGKTTPFWAGLEYTGCWGDRWELKADVGVAGDVEAEGVDEATTVLIESSVRMSERVSLTGTLYYQEDEAYIWGDQDAGVREFGDLFLYIEPGVSLGEHCALGLPIEYHEFDRDVEDDEQFWLVPTVYLYPQDECEIRLWGMRSKPLGGEDTDANFSAGMEIIAAFQ